MAFTGRLGSLNSKLGSIVLGFVDDFGAAAAGFTVHQLTSKKIRVNFGIKVLEGALDPSHYVLSSTAPPTVTKVPSVVSVSFYDENDRSVVVEYDLSLTYLSTYTMEVSNIVASTGDEIVRFARNFVVNVQDPPLAIGAWQSKRGFVDVLFDRDVGPTSFFGTFFVRDPAGGPGFAMVQVPWATTGAPATTLRLQLPAGTPTADSLVIDYAGVKDASFNVASGTVAITLAPQRIVSPPYSLADLLQLKFTSAVVLSVNPKKFFATVRVFFNGPTLDAGNPLNWLIFLPSPHQFQVSDPNAITAPDATDLPSLIALANDEKVQFNAHIVYPNYHVTDDPADAVTSPAATDLPTSIALLTEMMAKFIAHQNKGIPVHTYRTNDGFTGAPTDLPSAISWANTFKADFTAHQAITRPIPFDLSLPSAIAGIEDHSKYGNPDTVFDVSSPFTYYVDLRVSMDTEDFVVPVAVSGTITSEDGLSTTNFFDLSGLVIASSAVGDVSESFSTELTVFLGSEIFFPRIVPFFGNASPEESVEVYMHGANFSLPETLNFALSGPDGPVDLENVEVSASLPSVLWALNEAIFSYSVHIGAPGSGGATHLSLDTVNTIADPADYARLPLSVFFSAANSLKAKLNAHMASAVFHFQPDFAQVRSADADDVPSLVSLVDEIRRVLSSHNLLIGPHSAPGERNLTAPLYDVLRFSPSEMVDGSTYSLDGTSLTSLYLPGSFYEGTVVPQDSSGGTLMKQIRIRGSFVGVATRPSLASAVPRSGLVINEEGVFYVPDAIEVYFSKPMRQVPLDPSNLSVTGGVILQKETGWVSETLASMKVARMEAIPYSVTASGISDSSGNAVY